MMMICNAIKSGPGGTDSDTDGQTERHQLIVLSVNGIAIGQLKIQL